MKKLISCLIITLSFTLTADDKVIYGKDDRRDIYESKNSMFKTLARSTAGMIPDEFLVLRPDGTFKIEGATLEQEGICSDARFAKQTVAANCSGFLVGEDLLVTAGHCIETEDDCEASSWVFGFGNPDGERSEYNIPKKDIYKCTKIISRELDRVSMNDFALVKLDRKVEGRSALKFRKSGKIGNKASIIVIGHPSGLPTKIADGTTVRTNKNKIFFQAGLDTFGGNSGSAVFDVNTGLVEGILVRGERDYVSDPVQNCIRPKVCKITECRGEDVTRITNIKKLQTLTR